MKGIAYRRAKGVLVEGGGKFIFYWDDPVGTFRKLVLTDNDGKKLQSGYLIRNRDVQTEDTWKDDSTWHNRGTADYGITNFKATGWKPFMF